MTIFETIKEAIFGHPAAAAPPPTQAAGATAAPRAASGAQVSNAPGAGASAGARPPSSAAASAPLSQTALDAHLQHLMESKHQTLNWQTSIVDLMKLVDLDPSLGNRRQLAQELGFTGNTTDTAEMNVWLHRAVMVRLAQEGGQPGVGLH